MSVVVFKSLLEFGGQVIDDWSQITEQERVYEGREHHDNSGKQFFIRVDSSNISNT